MNKPFLLIAGYNYYPCAGTEDWIDRFESEQKALKQITVIPKRGRYDIEMYKINNQEYNWYKIVNLETWKKDE